MKQALTTTIRQKVINTSINKKSQTKKEKQKIARKEFEEAIKHKQNNIQQKKDLYIKTQETLRTIIEQEEKIEKNNLKT